MVSKKRWVFQQSIYFQIILQCNAFYLEVLEENVIHMKQILISLINLNISEQCKFFDYLKKLKKIVNAKNILFFERVFLIFWKKVVKRHKAIRLYVYQENYESSVCLIGKYGLCSFQFIKCFTKIKLTMLLKERGYYWSNGSFYFGQWQDNKINGVGLFINNDYIIIGQFSNGLMQGYCQLIYSNKFKYCKYENGLQVGLIKYEYFNGETIVDNTQTQDQEELDIINKLNHSYFLILLKTQLRNWKLIDEAQLYFSTVINQNENRRIGILYDIKKNKFEYGYFLNQQLDGKGGIVFEQGDKYIGDFKNGQLNGIGIFYDKSENQYTQSRFINNEIIEIIKQSKDPISLRNQWHQIALPDLICKNPLTPVKQSNYYSSKTQVSKLSKSISPMRPTVSIKKQAMYSQIKNYPNIEYKFGSIQSHFGKDDLNIIQPYRSKQTNSYIKQSTKIDDQSITHLRQQLFDDEYNKFKLYHN